MATLGRWWRNRVLAREREGFSEQDWAIAWEALPLLDGLGEPQRAHLADLALLFLRQKALEPVQGLELDPAMRLVIALQACLPVLGLDLDWYRGWYAVVVYPDQFVPGHEYVDEDGVVWVDDVAKSGEAWQQGPVILSWADIEAGLERDGYNVVIHEMAHKLDMRDGVANGCPPLHGDQDRSAWSSALSAAYADLRRRAEAGEDTPIDPYGNESPAELFAVVSEAFFEIPDVLVAEYPRVYEQLRGFYRQDPLARLPAASPGERA